MLQTLSIKNVALISSLTIDFSKGFNVLLGETGAGKSIIFDSLNFVLGGKADKTLIRYGEDSLRVDAIFSDLSESVKNGLANLGYEEEDICLSRTLSLEGKSSIRINGMISTQSVLKEIAGLLVDSYSQHEGVELLKTKNHLSLLDKFGGEKIAFLKQELKVLFNSYQDIIKRIKSLGGDEFERERTKSLLEYQINEIENARLRIGEDDEIAERLKVLNSAEKIFEAISSCEELLNNGANSCIRALFEASSNLNSLLSFEEIEDCKNRLDSTRYEIEDVIETLSVIKQNSEYDDKEFDRLDRRYDLIKSITKKYGGSIEKVLEYLSQSKSKYNDLVDSEFLLVNLEGEAKKVFGLLQIKANELTHMRKEVANDIEEKIMKELSQLAMKSSRFSVKFEPLKEITSNGGDMVEFEFSANKGQEVKSLAKTASGGELSRFMLAVKNIFAELGGAQTLVFDEIDNGISGETGNVVGQKINNISKFAQILCITHLPQVACHADCMFVVSKHETEDNTITNVREVKGEEITLQLAKMIVGDKTTEIALKQAKELRNNAGKGEE